MISNAKKLAKEAKVIVSGMAMFPSEDGKVLVVNLHNTRYRAKLDKRGNVFASNMSEKALKKVKSILLENSEFL